MKPTDRVRQGLAAAGLDPDLILELPADTRFLHVARLTTAGVAAEGGFTVSEIEDLKIAVDELCSVLITAGAGSEPVVIDYRLRDDGLVLEGARAGVAASQIHLDELVRAIFEATVDDVEIVNRAGTAHFCVSKQRSVG